MTENGFQTLVGIVARLRGQGGCPWDRAQTPQTLRPYLLEEMYEVLDAIDQDSPVELKKELGDVLFQLVLLAQIATEDGSFTLNDVLDGINQKMVVRHPHVFDPNYQVTGDEGDVSAWEARKAAQRATHQSALDGVPQALPSLLRAHRISEKAGVVGFDWPDLEGVRAKVHEEQLELDEAIESGDPDAIADEFGDLLFALVNLGRHLPTGAEEALRGATHKFERRFRALEARLHSEGGSVHHTSSDELEARWRAVKANEC
ncbi:MAG: nucleoside triphosphate pyrophosphohydrolase [Rhodobacterales bacterium]|nr:nucleoside triphosphate pyrophosphohydrolase [Rhodobacterales bacterium]